MTADVSLRDPWHTFASLLLLCVAVGGVVLHAFDVVGSRHFLVDLAYSETMIPIAHAGAAILAVLIMLPLVVAFIRAYERPEFRGAMPGIFPEQHGERVLTRNSASLFVQVTVVFGAAIYLLMYLGLLNYVPYARHVLGPQVETEERFTIRYASRQRNCRGVVGTNPAFYSESICGVRLPGDKVRYNGKEIVLTGRRSPYGFYVERYLLPDVSQTRG